MLIIYGGVISQALPLLRPSFLGKASKVEKADNDDEKELKSIESDEMVVEENVVPLEEATNEMLVISAEVPSNSSSLV